MVERGIEDADTYLGQLTYPFQKHEETPYG